MKWVFNKIKEALSDPLTIITVAIAVIVAAYIPGGHGAGLMSMQSLQVAGLTFGAMVAGNMAAAHFADEFSVDEMTMDDRNPGMLVRSTVSPHISIYGRTQVGGTLLFAEVDTGEQNLNMVVSIAGHEIESVDAITFDANPVHFVADPNEGRALIKGRYADDTTTSGSSDTNSIEILKGTDLQEMPSYMTTGYSLTSNDKFPGLAVALIRLQWNADKFPRGIPRVQFLVKGKKVRNLSLLNSGTTLTNWNVNPVSHFVDYLTDINFGMEVTDDFINLTTGTYGQAGKGTPASAAVCDESVTAYQSGSNYKQFTLTNKTSDWAGVNDFFVHTPTNGDAITDNVFLHHGDQIKKSDGSGSTYWVMLTNDVLSFDTFPTSTQTTFNNDTQTFRLATSLSNFLQGTAGSLSTLSGTYERREELRYSSNGAFIINTTFKQHIDSLTRACLGQVVFNSGLFNLLPAKWIDPTITITDDDLISDVAVTPKSSLDARFNTVKGTFIGAESRYHRTDFPTFSNFNYVAYDGEELEQNYSFGFVDSSDQAQRLARILLLLSRREKNFKIQISLAKAFQLAPGDRVNLSLPTLGIGSNVLTVSATTNLFIGQRIVGATSGASATIESFPANNVLGIIDVSGNFQSENIVNTSPTIAISAQGSIFKAQIQNISFAFQGEEGTTGALTLTEDDDSVYSVVSTDMRSISNSSDTVLPQLNFQAPVTNVQITGRQTLNKDGTITASVNITWTAPTTGYVSYYVAVLYVVNTSSGVKSEINSVELARDINNYRFVGVEDGTFGASQSPGVDGQDCRYSVEVSAYNYNDVRSAIVASGNVDLSGDTTAPAVPSLLSPSSNSLKAGNGQVTVRFTLPSDTDTAGAGIFWSTSSSTPSDGTSALAFVAGEASQLVNYAIVTNPDGSDLTNGTVIYVWIRSIDTSLNKSTYLSVGNATPNANTGQGASGITTITQAGDSNVLSPSVTGAVTFPQINTANYASESILSKASGYLDESQLPINVITGNVGVVTGVNESTSPNQLMYNASFGPLNIAANTILETSINLEVDNNGASRLSAGNYGVFSWQVDFKDSSGSAVTVSTLNYDPSDIQSFTVTMGRFPAQGFTADDRFTFQLNGKKNLLVTSSHTNLFFHISLVHRGFANYSGYIGGSVSTPVNNALSGCGYTIQQFDFLVENFKVS